MITLTQKVTISVEFQAHDEQGNPAAVFQNNGQPSPGTRLGVDCGLTAEAFAEVLKHLQEQRAQFIEQLKSEPEAAAETEAPEETEDASQSPAEVPPTA
jgi:hypothetical protein